MTTAKGHAFESSSRADLARTTLRHAADERGESLASLSRLVRRNAAYLQQYLERGSPRALPDDVRHALAQHLGIDERLLGAQAPYHPPTPMPAGLRNALDRYSAFRSSRGGDSEVIDAASGLTIKDLDTIVAALHDR